MLYVTKAAIERFANALVTSRIKNPLFVEEIERYPESYLHIDVKLKD